jgi:hypothetical protein
VIRTVVVGREGDGGMPEHIGQCAVANVEAGVGMPPLGVTHQPVDVRGSLSGPIAGGPGARAGYHGPRVPRVVSVSPNALFPDRSCHARRARTLPHTRERCTGTGMGMP